MNISLNELEGCTGGRLNRTSARDITAYGVSTDICTLKIGDIFVLLEEKCASPEEYAQAAEIKGAAVIVTDLQRVYNHYNGENSTPCILVNDARNSLFKIAKYYRSTLRTKIIAITGACGKTTVKHMLSCILSSKYRIASTIKCSADPNNPALSIFKINPDDQYAILELPIRHMGEIEMLSAVCMPDISVITNSGYSNIEEFGSIQAIAQELLSIMRGGIGSGCLLVNGDDKYLENIQFKNTFFVNTGKCEGSFAWAENQKITNNGISFEFNCGGNSEEMFLGMANRHNITNALLACACAVKCGMTLCEIKEGISTFNGIPFRNDLINLNGVSVIRDYFATEPASIAAALHLLEEFSCNGKKVALIGEPPHLGNFGSQISALLGEVARNCCSHCLFFGRDYRAFAQSFSSDDKNVLCFGSRKQLLDNLEEFIQNCGISGGDTISIIGSPEYRMEEIFARLKLISSLWTNPLYRKQCASGAILYVDVAAVRHNFDEIKKAVGKNVEVMPVLKANAYSCGVSTIAGAFSSCRCIAAADAKEAVNIKYIYPEKDVMILYQPDFSEIEAIVDNDIIAGCCNFDFLKSLNQFAHAKNKNIRVHLSVDTGSGRLGIKPSDCTEFALQAKKLKNITVEGLYTHFCVADSTAPHDMDYTAQQTRSFRQAIASFEDAYGKELIYKHACSSGGIFLHPDARFNMVRPGYILYGYYPTPEIKNYITLEPAITLAAKIVFIKDMPENHSISYGRTFITSKKSRIATVSIGYSDGLHRSLSNNGYFVVNGQRAPIVGRVCMDMTMIDITDIKGEVSVGDEVYVFDNVNVTLEEVADICGTIGYEVISHIESGVERIER